MNGRRMTRREFFRLSATMAAGALAAACAPGTMAPAMPAPATPAPPKPKAERYTLWFNTLFHSGDAQAMERIVKLYNETHEDTQITLTQGQWAEYYAQLTNAVIAGNPPQIGIVHTNKLTEMYPALTPLEDTPAGNLLEIAGIRGEDYIEKLWKAGERDGHRYLVPLDTHMWGLWYNRTIFQEAGLDPDSPPQTMDEVVAASDAIRDAGYYAFHPAEDAPARADRPGVPGEHRPGTGVERARHRRVQAVHRRPVGPALRRQLDVLDGVEERGGLGVRLHPAVL